MNNILNNPLNKNSNKNLAPDVVEAAKPIVSMLIELGLDKLIILFNDESQAKVVLENCKLFLLKYNDRDWDIPRDISLSLSSLLLVLDTDRLYLLKLEKDYIEKFNNSLDLFYICTKKLGNKNKKSTKKNNDVYFDILMELIEELQKLSTKWEEYKHVSRNLAFSSGVEDGLFYASGKVKELINLVRDRVEQAIKEEEGKAS